MRVDVRGNGAWLSPEEYDEVKSQVETSPAKSASPLFAGVIGGFLPGTVVLYKVSPDQMPELSDYIVETDVAGLLEFVEWKNTGLPGQNPLVTSPA